MELSADRPRLIALFTDFGCQGPYLGQMAAVLAAAGVELPVVNLLADAPRFDPRASAYLLAALADNMPSDSLIIGVVDPGVGGERQALLARSARVWLVGPDNGLLSQVLRRDATARAWRVDWRPPHLSDSFHGRDLFAPVAAAVCNGQPLALSPLSATALCGHDWPDDLPEIVYIDHYGNAFTGIRGASIPRDARLQAGGVSLGYARTFCSVARGTPFWYVNSQGLVEVAVSEGRADRQLGLGLGSRVVVD